MLKLSLVVPEATINYVKNPNCRFDTTGYSAAGATLTRSLDFSRFGVASLKVVTNGTVLREGLYYRVNALSGLSGPVTVSAYVIGTGVVRIRLIDNPTGKEWPSQNVTLRTDRFTRLSVSGTITGSDDVRLYVETDEGIAKVRTFYVGGLQMERKAYATTFCDGDQPGCRWNGIYHASASQRAADTRAGGRWVQIVGEEREEQDLYVTVVSGMGKAGVKNNTQSYAMEPGSYFQNKKVTDRVITLTFHAKHKVDEREEAISLAALHQLRQLLIDLIKPDRTGGDEEILFEYDDGVIPLYFKARYDAGLEGQWDIRNQWVNSFPLRLLAVSPFFYEDQQVTTVLDFQNTLQVKHALARINGVWNNLNSGFNDAVYATALGPRGQVYMGGQFTVANNVSTAVSPLIPAVVAYYDGEKWVAIATSKSVVGDVLALAVAANGDVYAGGTFTSIHGVAASRIAKYTAATGTWSALGTGASNQVSTIAIAPNGDVYIGGAFTTAGGVSCFRIARWDGFEWRRLGQYGGLNNTVTTIVISQDGTRLYAGGNFTNEQGDVGAAVSLVAQYDIAGGTFSVMGDGFTSAAGHSVEALLITENGIIYAAGNFDQSGTTVLSNVAQWTGGSWIPVGAGLDNTVRDLDYFKDGNLVASGLFQNSGSLPVRKVALFNGSTWTNIDEELIVVGSEIIYECLVNRAVDDLYLAGIFNNPGSYKDVLVSGMTTVDNTGSAEVLPRIYTLGPGTLHWVENQTNHKRLYLDMEVLSGEEVFIDFAKGTIESTVRGNLLYSMLPGSNFRSFTLLPGENILATLMTNDVDAKMGIYFTPQHWSADATQSVESL